MNEELRYYGFCNYYLSQLQYGLQNAHVIAEMSQDDYNKQDFLDWAIYHKTIILLNGGNQKALQDLLDFIEFSSDDNPRQHSFKYGYFREDDESLNGCMTAVGIILPKRVYDYNPETDLLSGFEWELAVKLKTYRLI